MERENTENREHFFMSSMSERVVEKVNVVAWKVTLWHSRSSSRTF